VRLPRTLTPLLAVALAALVSGCGETHPLRADTEGVYLQLGPLRYQVEISRELNPRDLEDVSYLQGLRPTQAGLTPSQSWYGVWVLVENRSSAAQTPTADFTITDTEHTVYRPIFPNPTNRFAYQSYLLPGHGQIPGPEGAAYNGPTQGALILFKIRRASYDNRPLEFAITDPATGRTATTDLDV
jgi:hypothetical protein